MDNYVICETVETLIEKLKNNDISKVAIASIDEKRSIQVDKTTVQVVDYKRHEILAYKDALIYKCIIEDQPVDEIYNLLTEHGLDVTKTSRNII